LLLKPAGKELPDPIHRLPIPTSHPFPNPKLKEQKRL